ncbi:MAG: stage II sporulation protein M [Termitinemataceae bacterium]|nr:MAG: stage II sporulation protein M [Termitinemataceae bacterium]
MTEFYFLQQREKSWNDFEVMLLGGKKEIKKNAGLFVESLRDLTSDLNTSKANAFDPAITERLNRLVNDGSHILYKKRSLPLKEFLSFIIKTFPQAVRKNWKVIIACHVIFYGLYIFFALLCAKYKDVTNMMIDAEERHNILSMYDPSSRYFLKPRNITNDADMFGFYIYNNVTIAFRTFAAGFFAGIGSLVSLIFNAVFLGAVTGLIIDAGFTQTFFSFIAGHSPFELTGIVFSAAAGILLGWSVFFTNGLSRSASIRKYGKTAAPLIAGSAMMIVVAAVIEAFFSSRHEVAVTYHYAFGGFFWIILIAYFLFCGRKKQKTQRV